MHIEFRAPSYCENKLAVHKPRCQCKCRIAVGSIGQGNEEEVIADVFDLYYWPVVLFLKFDLNPIFH